MLDILSRVNNTFLVCANKNKTLNKLYIDMSSVGILIKQTVENLSKKRCKCKEVDKNSWFSKVIDLLIMECELINNNAWLDEAIPRSIDGIKQKVPKCWEPWRGIVFQFSMLYKCIYCGISSIWDNGATLGSWGRSEHWPKTNALVEWISSKPVSRGSVGGVDSGTWLPSSFKTND